MEYRILSRGENHRLKEIDRAEIIEKVYRFVEGQLILEEKFYDVKGWHPREVEEYIEILNEIFDRGGTIYGAFDGNRICGIGALDSEWKGRNKDYLKLDKLYISKGDRGKGIGTELVTLMKNKAKEMGARKLYVSATPFENTVNFYMGVGCILAEEFIKELQELEPEDIHLELKL